MKMAIIDYGAGNLHSVARAVRCAVDALGGELEIQITSDPETVKNADRIILPGDGAFRDCRHQLGAISGMDEALEQAVRQQGRPFLGICVGMQMLADTGLEHGETAGLGWIPGTVRKIAPKDPALKVPHMGWNTLRLRIDHPLLKDIALGREGYHAYFLHAYYLEPDNDNDVIAEADYGDSLTAVVARGNIAGTQFHPEKSQQLGQSVLRNFLRWQP